MTENYIEIGPWQLALAAGFVLAAGIASLVYKLRLERDMTIGVIRTFVQLLLMGYVLRFLFDLNWMIVSIGVFLVMTTAAYRIVRRQVGSIGVSYDVPLYFSMLVSYFVVAILVTGVVVQARPWWDPVYFIPMGGMVIGNSMNAIAIALERLFSSLREKRNLVEMRLCLGATPEEATEDIVRDSIKAGMIPSINSMMGVGLVFIPGMMTGQILAGAEPTDAVRYQIVVMVMIVGSTALGSILTVLLCRKRAFGSGQRLIISRNNKKG